MLLLYLLERFTVPSVDATFHIAVYERIYQLIPFHQTDVIARIR